MEFIIDPVIVFGIFVSFFITFFSLPYWISKCKEFGLTGKDLHKIGKNEVAEAGGLMVLLGLVVGILIYIGFQSFFLHDPKIIVDIFALLCVVLIAGGLGMIDDLLGWKKGLSKKVRIGVMILAAIPLMVINAGNSTMLGVDFGLLYPLLFIPFGVMAVTTSYNFLAGYNGLEARQGILLLTALGIVCYMNGSSYLGVIAACGVAALIGFLFYNSIPARVFPGDALTYSIGALFVGVVVLGNIEKIAIVFFVPYILEVVLKARGRLSKESFGKLNKDGSLDMPYKKIYGLEHLAIWIVKKIRPSGKAYEGDVVFLVNMFQVLFILIGFLIM